jgi:ABC-type uncharacterized transport system substrate-binding protein
MPWRDELQKLGWDEGRNLRFDVSFIGADNIDRARTAAADLVRRTPDVILLAGCSALKTIPIVFQGLVTPLYQRAEPRPSCGPGHTKPAVQMQRLPLNLPLSNA